MLIKPDYEIVSKVYEALVYLAAKDVEIVLEQNTFRYLETYSPFQKWIESDPSLHKRISFFSSSDESLDLIITFGGDGLLLHCNKLFNFSPIPPVMSFDFGSLGFLTPFQFEEYYTEVKYYHAR